MTIFEGLLAIVKYFGGFNIALAICYAFYTPIFNYMVKHHKKLMKKIIPDYFTWEKHKPY